MEKTDDSDELRFMRIVPPFLWKGGAGGIGRQLRRQFFYADRTDYDKRNPPRIVSLIS